MDSFFVQHKASADTLSPWWNHRGRGPRISTVCLLAATFTVTSSVVVATASDPWHLTVLLLCAPSFIAIAWIDLHSRRIPDLLLGPAYLITLVGLALNAETETAMRSAVAFLVATIFFGIGTLAGHVGFGDVKLSGLLAVLLAWDSYATTRNAALIAIGLAGLYASWLIATRRHQDRFAFGPALLLGSLAALAIS